MTKLLKRYDNLSQPLKATIWFTICSFLQKGISLITVPIFTRLLTADQYGLYNVYQSWLGIVAIFATLNLSAGLFNIGMVKFEDDRDRLTSSLQGLSTIVTTILFIVYILFYKFWNNLFDLPTVLVVAMFCELLVAPALCFWSTRQRFDYKYNKLVLVTLIISISTPIIGILAVLLADGKGEAKILSTAGVNFCICLIIYLYNFKKGKSFFVKKYWKYALAFNIPLIPHYLSGIILNQADRIMINSFCGTDKAGIYSVAYSAAMIMSIVTNSINSTLVPWTYKKLKAKLYSDIGEIANCILIVVTVIILTLIAFAPEIVKILAPHEYFEAIWVVPPVAASVFFNFLYCLFANIEFYYEENKFIMIASVFGAILNIILNLIFIPLFGYIAAGYTTLVCYIAFSFCHYAFMRIVCKKHKNNIKIYNLKVIIIISVAIIIFSMALMSVYNHMVIRYIFVLVSIFILIAKRNNIAHQLKLAISKFRDEDD